MIRRRRYVINLIKQQPDSMIAKHSNVQKMSDLN